MEHNLSIEEISRTETFRKNLEVVLFARRRASLEKYKARKKAGMAPIEDPVDLLAHWKAETAVKVYQDILLRQSRLPASIRNIVRELGDAAVRKTLQDYTERAANL